MGLKTIFQEGMKERKRKKSLNKVSSELKDKEKTHTAQLTALGQKAWEAKADISAFPDLKAALGEAQEALDDLRAQAERLQKQKQDGEAKKKQENERLSAGQKEAEGKKREADGRLNEQKNTLQGGQKEMQRTMARLAAIAKERVQLQSKSANPETTEAEKGEIVKGLGLLAGEEAELKTANQAREEAGKPLAAALASLQEESGQLQKQLEGLRQEQKKVTSELDKQIAALNNDLARNAEKTMEAEGRQRLDFKSLGEKLAAAQGVAPDIAKEMTAVLNARAEMEGVQSLIGGLERQKDEGQVSAYKKMMAIIIGGVVLVAALVVVLLILLSPKKNDSPLSGLSGPVGGTVKNLETMAQQLQESFNGSKDEGENAPGQKIVVASEGALKSILPVVDGWQLQNPYYSQGKFQQLATAALQADYVAADGRTVQLQVTDAGSASALLAPLKMVFSLNLKVDDQDATQRISTFNGIPLAERFDKHSQEASFGIVYKDRYLVEMKTKAEKGLELLRQFAAKLDLAKLQP
jgi:myosin heavy subunit